MNNLTMSEKNRRINEKSNKEIDNIKKKLELENTMAELQN